MTETGHVQRHADDARPASTSCVGCGVKMAVDDFGTGDLSLSYLRRFRVDILKIARDFVVRWDADPDEWAFAHAIVALGQTLGLKIVAEGIEESGQLERLRDMGCEFGRASCSRADHREWH